jgi:uncharacterized short protein YbdD (DUF466 family)
VPERTTRIARRAAGAALALARLLARRLAEVLAGAGGTQAYGAYCAHLARHHPGCEPLTREQFFRESLDSRWDGIKRCC